MCVARTTGFAIWPGHFAYIGIMWTQLNKVSRVTLGVLMLYDLWQQLKGESSPRVKRVQISVNVRVNVVHVESSFSPVSKRYIYGRYKPVLKTHVKYKIT